jgi:hypothetical protein
MSKNDLADICSASGLAVGTKFDMIDSLVKHHMMERERDETLRSLEAGRIADIPKKYRDITIISLKLPPETKSKSGSPLFSIEVLESLAGSDPFGEGKNHLFLNSDDNGWRKDSSFHFISTNI